MIKEINLLQKHLEESESEKKIKALIKIVSPIALIVFIILVVIVYSYSSIQSAQANDVNHKINNTLSSIQSQSQTESYEQGVKMKLGLVKQVFNNQIDYAEVTKELQRISPPEIIFNSLAVSSDKNIDVTYKAPNSDIFKELINSLLDPKIGGVYYDQIKMNSLIFNREGSYLISLSLHLK